MNSYVTGFLETAKRNGISDKEASTLLKIAVAADPGVAEQAGMQAGIGAPGPEQLGAGQPPMPGAEGGDSGIPPELEQLIASLPPEVLQQLLAEVEQELSGGGAGGPPPGAGGPPPGAGGPPPEQMKQGEFILAKTAEYQEGFLEAARYYGVSQNDTVAMYKRALAEMEQNPIDTDLFIDSQEKRAAHYEGFVLNAVNHGLTQAAAIETYKNTFLN